MGIFSILFFLLTIGVQLILIYKAFEKYKFKGGYVVCLAFTLLNAILNGGFSIILLVLATIISLIPAGIYYAFYKHSNTFKSFVIKYIIMQLIIAVVVFGVYFYITINITNNVLSAAKNIPNMQVVASAKEAIVLSNYNISSGASIDSMQDLINIINENYYSSESNPIKITPEELPEKMEGKKGIYEVNIDGINETVKMVIEWGGEFYKIRVATEEEEKEFENIANDINSIVNGVREKTTVGEVKNALLLSNYNTSNGASIESMEDLINIINENYYSSENNPIKIEPEELPEKMEGKKGIYEVNIDGINETVKMEIVWNGEFYEIKVVNTEDKLTNNNNNNNNVSDFNYDSYDTENTITNNNEEDSDIRKTIREAVAMANADIITEAYSNETTIESIDEILSIINENYYLKEEYPLDITPIHLPEKKAGEKDKYKITVQNLDETMDMDIIWNGKCYSIKVID